MKKVTAKDLLNEQKKRFWRLSQKEKDNSAAEDAKACFRRAPYMGLYQKQGRRNDNPGGRR